MIIHAISDLHGYYPELKGGDVLIIAGDCTANDSMKDWSEFFDWLEKQNYRKKIIVAGNHDNFCNHLSVAGTFTDEEYDQIYPGEKPLCDYLCDSGIEFEGIKFWGSPWTLKFKGMNPICMAFTGSEDDLMEKLKLIPNDIDVLITHSPPYGILDKTKHDEHVGSESLRLHMLRIKPKIMIFGHIHECGGKNLDLTITKCFNVSHVNEHYKPNNSFIEIFI